MVDVLNVKPRQARDRDVKMLYAPARNVPLP